LEAAIFAAAHLCCVCADKTPLNNKKEMYSFFIGKIIYAKLLQQITSYNNNRLIYTSGA
jgi:hypothetical protein